MKIIKYFPILSRIDFLLFRIFGPGLGNLLFPVYRAFQQHKKYGGILIFPQFFQLKFGPYIRGEKDKRTYYNIFEKRSIRELYNHLLVIFSDGINESKFELGIEKYSGVTVKYSGINDFFLSLDQAYTEEFKNYLIERMTYKNLFKNEIRKINKNDICVHIRRGDYIKNQGETDNGELCYQIEDEWYVEAVRIAKQKYNLGKIRVFTDDMEISRDLLIALHCDEVDVSRTPLHALLKMSNHGAIVASKSTFSLWSAFLGQQEVYIKKEFVIEEYINLNLINRI